VIFNICPATFSLPSDCSSLDKYGKRKIGGEREMEREKETGWIQVALGFACDTLCSGTSQFPLPFSPSA